MPLRFSPSAEDSTGTRPLSRMTMEVIADAA
jgi:hypothetical protein